MKKLTRTGHPLCLSRFTGANRWGDCLPPDKEIIWQHLNEMQKGYCAYCECKLVKSHIEHFRSRSDYPALTFNWDNLFGSCHHTSRCGHYKDSSSVKPYSPDELIKPDVDDCKDYLVFLTTGKVRAIDGLNGALERKANETIRVFNLNADTALVNSRKVALQSELPLILELYGSQDILTEEEFKEYLMYELQSIVDREYITALHHAWLYNTSY